MGDGRRGRGVYAVPLFRAPRYRPKDIGNDIFESWSQTDLSIPTATGDAWRWLFGDGFCRGRRPIAVVFEIPRECWPVELFLYADHEVGRRFAPALQLRPIAGAAIGQEHLRYMARELATGVGIELWCSVHSAVALGSLLNLFVMAGGRLGFAGDDGLEIVIRRPVPRTAVVRLVALSQKNIEARQRRQQTLPDE
jgi:hypothetical protein